MLDLVIISGCSKGIGLNIAKDLSLISRSIIGISSSDKIYDVKLPNQECNFLASKIDLHYYGSAYAFIRSASKIINPQNIGIVLCGASIGEYGGLFDSYLDDWEKLYKSNVLGNLAIIKGCEGAIKNNIKTRIVFFGGGGAAAGYPEFSGYAMSKVAVVRAVENIGIEFEKNNYDASIIALAPGAVDTDMLAKVIKHGGTVKTKTDISEPTAFVHKFLTDEFNAKSLNGRFLHARDNIKEIDFAQKDMRKLRRIE